MEQAQTSFPVEILKATLDGLSETFVLLSSKHKILLFNNVLSSVIKLLFQREPKIGEDYRKYVFEHDQALFLNSFEQALQGHTIIRKSAVTHNNVTLELSYKMHPVYDDDGLLMGVALYARNMAMQKRATQAIENIQNTFEAIFNHIPDSVCLLNSSFQLLQFNQYFSKRIVHHTGKTPAIGDDIQQYLFPTHKEIFYEQFYLAKTGETTEKEVKVINQQGEEVWFLSRMYPVYTTQQTLMGVCLIAINITARKIAEQTALENELKFKKIIDTAPVPIIIVDENLQIVLVNPETERFFHYQAYELQQQHINILVPEHFRVNDIKHQQTYLDHSQKYNMGINRLTPAVTKDGIEKMVEVSLNSFRLDDKLYILAIIQDMTQHVRHETQLKKQVEALEKIAWQHAHEIRRPVANILGLVNLMQLDTNKASQELYSTYLHQSAIELDKVIHQIITLASDKA